MLALRDVLRVSGFIARSFFLCLYINGKGNPQILRNLFRRDETTIALLRIQRFIRIISICRFVLSTRVLLCH